MPPPDNQEQAGAAGTEGAKPQPGVPKKIDDILLPKKEVHSPASAQRVNAGILLEQEQGAVLQPQAEPEQAKPTPPSGASPAAAVKERSLVQPLETYRGAIESVVQQKKVSVLSIAADEAKRRGETPMSSSQGTASEHEVGFTIAAIAGGLLLLTGSAALLAFILYRPQANAPVVSAPQAPFIAIDDTRLIAIPPTQWQRNTVLGTTDAARQSTTLSLGLMARLYLTQTTDTATLPPLVPIGTFLSTIAPSVSDELLRSFSGEYLLGVHSFDSNQAFLILGVEGFEAAYAGMLAWEVTMPQELMPLFTRTPRPRIPEENITPIQSVPILPYEESAATSSAVATSSSQTATSTTEISPTPSPAEDPRLPEFFRTRFVDRIVENYDARVIQDEFGDILLLWTFLDRSTLVITTNDATLREIISRRTRPPVVPL